MERNRKMGEIVLTSDAPGIKVGGDCEFYIGLIWSNGVMWRITEYSPVYEFTVSFTPYKLFGNITRSSSLKIFDSPKKAKLLSKYASYKCAKEDFQYYLGGLSEETTYKVLVAVTTIQVQVANLWHDQYSPSLCECGTKPWYPIIVIGESGFPANSWQLFVLIAVSVACMIIGALGTLLILQRLIGVKRKKRLLGKLCVVRRGKTEKCWQWTNM
ncbi:hypothetical protein EGW08_021522 [Elysia chlorotica]|uniref:Uncharacterized protein n=1 Tax=Elysia chlorotica TaxID=188477 RepID=A0A3S0ZMA8_ELYCH|nr:hypothetical protein EGW08_021522 [Elysia chlorotica]